MLYQVPKGSPSRALLCAVLLLCFQCSYAQSWKWAIGNNITQYAFKTSSGIPVDMLKPSSGLHIQLAHEHVLLDTVRLISKFSKSAIFFSQNLKIAKVMSYFTYEIGLKYDQWNAVGDVQQIAFAYQTDFLGAQIGLGPTIPIYRGWFISTKGLLSGHKLLAGNQLVGARYYSLTIDDQFTPIKFLWGYHVEVVKRINTQLSAFAAYQRMQTTSSTTTATGSLGIQPTTISFGIKLSGL